MITPRRMIKNVFLFIDARDVLVVYLISLVYILSMFMVKMYEKGLFTKVYTSVFYPEQKQQQKQPVTKLEDLPLLKD